ncbi:MAG: ABC transporter ATP-binding protein [Acidobacteriota bacterium]
MKTLRFLAPYFSRYWPQAALAVLATIGYAAATVLLLVLFQVVLSDVIRTDAGVADLVPVDLGAGGESSESADTDGDGADAAVEVSANLMETFLDAYTALRQRFGIGDDEVLYFVPILLVIVILVRSICQFANGYLFQVIGLGATNDLRNDLYGRILAQSSRFFAEHPSGELVSRVSNDITVLQTAMATRFVDLFQQVPTLIGLLWILFSIDVRLSLFCLLVVPAIAYPIARFGKGMRRTSHKSQERLADVSNLVAEAARGHRVVKAFGMEGFELERFTRATDRHLRTKLKAQLLAYASSPVIETMAAVGGGAFLIYAGRAVRSAELAPSMLVTFLVTGISLYDPVRKLNKVNLMLQEALAAGARVQSIVEEPNDIVDRPGARAVEPIREAISFSGVTFAYEDQQVLRGVDLEIRRGEIVAFVGPSGAGKSTLVNLLPRFIDPAEGSVSIDGHDLRDVTLDSLRAQIGIVTQDTVLFDGTVRENIAYGRADLPLETVRAAAKAAYADEFVMTEKGGYDAHIGESGVRLSGGQRQRLAIARALLKNPPVLILDEATSNLDTQAEALVQKALYHLMEGRTALVIAHRLSTVQRADRIVVMQDGRVQDVGTHAELLARGGLYRELYDAQFEES